jgi:hypothetical protein
MWMTAALALAVAVNLIYWPLARALPLSTAIAGLALLMLFGAALVVSLVELSMGRYASPTRFIWFLSLPLLTWIVVEWCSLGMRRRRRDPDSIAQWTR